MYYTPSAAARKLGVHRETLRRWDALGILPFKVSKSPGGHRRYPKDAIDKLKGQIIAGLFPEKESTFIQKLNDYLLIEGIEEILLNKHDEMLATIKGKKYFLISPFKTDAEVRADLKRMFPQNDDLVIQHCIDEQTRMEAYLYPVSPQTCFTIRCQLKPPSTHNGYVITPLPNKV